MKKILPLISIVTICSNAIAQNVGIGTNSPTEKLHVAGNMKADTVKPNAVKLTPNAGVGKVLTSDATGNASWQERSVGGGVGFGSWGDCATNPHVSEYNPVGDTAAGSNLGVSCSISGNFAIIGGASETIGANLNQGSASIYQHNGSRWVFMQKLIDATGADGDEFGRNVSISGNYAIVGAYLDDVGANANQGSVSIYQYNGSSWILMQKITDATGDADDYFGYDVSISGNYAIVGAYLDNVGLNTDQGSVSIYQNSGGTWVLMQKLTDASGAASDYFGFSVSVSGNYAITGALRDDEAVADQGSASIYYYNGSSWIFMEKLTDAAGDPLDYFGYSVSISANYVLIGVPQDEVGANTNQGSASIYRYNGSSWELQLQLSDAAGEANDFFGGRVSLSGNYVIVSAIWDDVGANTNQGSASIYFRVGNGWNKLQYVTDPMGVAFSSFGFCVGIEGNTQRFLVGDPSYANGSGKVIFGKLN